MQINVWKEKEKQSPQGPHGPHGPHGHQSPQVHTFLSYRITQDHYSKEL